MRCFFIILGFCFYWSNSQVFFEDLATDLGVNNHTGTIGDGSGLSFVDYNNDGLDDLTFTSGNNVPIRFYKNIGGFFVEENLFNQELQYAVRSVSWVDYDNDGDKDLFISSDTSNGNRLFKREGDLLFDVTQESGLPIDNLSTYGISWGDIDNDGCLDLYLSNRIDIPPITNYLFKNNCDGTFTDITSSSGLSGTSALSHCAGFFDMNNDGWQDLYIANDKNDPNVLFKNNGDGTFTDISISSGSNIVIDAMSVTIDDYDADGYFDIYITNTPAGIATTTTNGSVLLKNNGDETFTNVAVVNGSELDSWCWGANFLDSDNDGDLDIYVSCSYTSSDGYPSYGYFENQTLNNYVNSTIAGFDGNDYLSYGSAIGDINNDGKVDIAVINDFNTNPNIWKNETTNNNNYLIISLKGTTSNKDGIGAVIEISVNGQKQYRCVVNGESYLSQNSLKEFFGLGQNSVVDYVKVKWPSGKEDIYYNVIANQMLTIVEGTTLSLPNYNNDLALWPNPVKNHINIKTQTRFDSMEIRDITGKIILTYPVTKNEFCISLPHINSGLLFLTLKNNTSRITKTLIKN